MSLLIKIGYKRILKRFVAAGTTCWCDTGGAFSTQRNETISTIYALSSGIIIGILLLLIFCL